MADGSDVKLTNAINEKKIYECKICHLEFPDIYSYTEHLETREHNKAFMKKKYAKKYLEAKERLDNRSNNKEVNEDVSSCTETTLKAKSDLKAKTKPVSTESKSDSTLNSRSDSEVIQSSEPTKITTESSKGSDTGDSSDSDDDVYTCELCKKICTGAVSYKLHLSGKKHRKKEKEIKTMKELQRKNLVPSSYREPDQELLCQLTSKHKYASSDIICDTCGVACTGPKAYMQHTKGESHRKKEEKVRLKEDMEEKGLLPNQSTENPYACEICNKAFSGIVPYNQHMDSPIHIKRALANMKIKKVNNICQISPQSSKLKCKVCNKEFSGPGPFEDHLKSHEKMQKKNDLYEELKKNYPEMIMTKVDDDEEEVMKPACSICSIIFSGPETANDHFMSSKHKKAVKKKQQIDKNKIEKKEKKSQQEPLLIEDSKTDKIKTATESSDDDFERISL